MPLEAPTNTVFKLPTAENMKTSIIDMDIIIDPFREPSLLRAFTNPISLPYMPSISHMENTIGEAKTRPLHVKF